MYYRVFGSHITLRLYPYLYAGAISISKKYILYNTTRNLPWNLNIEIRTGIGGMSWARGLILLADCSIEVLISVRSPWRLVG